MSPPAKSGTMEAKRFFIRDGNDRVYPRFEADQRMKTRRPRTSTRPSKKSRTDSG